ncbi:MAG: hypothetical protein ACYC59_06260 [Anaerolineaceae bacterium]
MLRTFNFTPTFPVRKTKNTEISRILSAAVINEPFCQLLLDSPIHAIESGFHDEYFNVNAQELAKIEAIHASNLVDFATKISNF